MALACRVLVKGAHGALDPEQVALALKQDFYRPLMPGAGTLKMHELPFTPKDHLPALTGTGAFNPAQHNWLRHDKVPVLVLNATTLNTGHGWQFTPTWMRLGLFTALPTVCRDCNGSGISLTLDGTSLLVARLRLRRRFREFSRC
jgi:hypothetical protein